MVKNLILIDKFDIIDEIFNLFLSNINIFPHTKSLISSYIKRIKLEKSLNKLKSSFKEKNVKILFINKLTQLIYRIPFEEIKERHLYLLKKGRIIFDYLEKQTSKYDKNYRDLDMHMVYENNFLRISLEKFLFLNLAIQILLEKYKFNSIIIPEDHKLIFKLFQLNIKDKNVNLYTLKVPKLAKILKKFISYLGLDLSTIRGISLRFSQKKAISHKQVKIKNEIINNRCLIETKPSNIGFFYQSITHRRVGNDIANYLKSEKFNAIEINPTTPLYYEILKRFYHPNQIKKRILFQFKLFFYETIKNFNDPLFSLFLIDQLEKIFNQITSDFIKIDYIYKKILKNKLNLLIIFNDNSFEGKVAIYICKQFKIPTLYIPHGAITETYIFVFPKWCDVMILNSEIEKDFLLNGKLDPKVYSDRLIPLGISSIKPKKLQKINEIQDIYKKVTFNLNHYNYKILLAVGSGKQDPFINFNIFYPVINVLKNQVESQKILLIIKLHPADDYKIYEDFFKRNFGIPIVITYKMDIKILINVVDLFISTPSTTILEALLLKTPAIILNYYFYPGYYLFCNDQIITTVSNQSELSQQIKKHLYDREFRDNYIKTTYKFGLKFCKGYNDINFKENIHKNLIEIIQKLIKK